TEADKRSHEKIKEIISSSSIPILSEEGRQLSYDERRNWKKFWLVDPLDGTKEFIKRNGEFTVNIALVEDGVPVAGVVYVPVTGKTYYGSRETGSYSFTFNENDEKSIDAYINDAEKLPD